MRKSQMPNYELRMKRHLAPTLAPLTRIRNATLFFALKVQHNLTYGYVQCVILWSHCATLNSS